MHGWHCYIFKTYPPDKLYPSFVQPAPGQNYLSNYSNFNYKQQNMTSSLPLVNVHQPKSSSSFLANIQNLTTLKLKGRFIYIYIYLFMINLFMITIFHDCS